MSNLLVVKKKEKKSTSYQHRTFNSRHRKIDKMHRQLEKLAEEYDSALALYQKELRPLEKKTGKAVADFILTVNDIIDKNPNALNQEEEKAWGNVLIESLNMIFTLLPYDEIDDRLKKCHQAYNPDELDEFEEEKASLEKMFEEDFGLEGVDFSGISAFDNVEEVVQKVMASLANAAEEQKEEKEAFKSATKPKPKSKKELLKEQKIREFEALQQKSLSNIYKRLAKEFHPDLELDSERKQEKELLMKQLTDAYEKNDLVTLLRLEADWFQHLEDAADSLNDDTLKVYNAILKEQIDELEKDMQMITLNPRYFVISRYIADYPKAPVCGIHEAIDEYEELHTLYSKRVKSLKVPNPIEVVKQGVASSATVSLLNRIFVMN